MSIFQILHISDLHIRVDNNFDRSVVLDPLIKRIGDDLKDPKSSLKPEIIVVTGDIAYSGQKDEYTLAKILFDDLLKKLEISNDRLFIVPGNHDVDFGKYRKTDFPTYENEKELNDELEHELSRADFA
jgi:3',5'-cyclic AMP phosphodiesterase CpdA